IDVQVGSLLFTKSGSIGRTCIVRNNIKYGLVESVGVINLINVMQLPKRVACRRFFAIWQWRLFTPVFSD
ncbi:MAG: hypothetical protein PHR20_08970, partial [Bacteroidales bacterium]|nr:hypothetical protein [Bacteroidales bacterium]